MSVSRISTSSTQNGFPKYTALWDGSTAVGSMEAIASITLSASQKSIEFNNIPQTYTHLQIRAALAYDTAPDDSSMQMGAGTIDNGANYAWHQIYAYNSSKYSNNGYSTSYFDFGYGYNATYGSSVVMDILDYTNTNKYKTVRVIHGTDNNGTGLVGLRGGHWRNGNGAYVDTIRIYGQNYNFSSNSTFSLYGIK